MTSILSDVTSDAIYVGTPNEIMSTGEPVAGIDGVGQMHRVFDLPDRKMFVYVAQPTAGAFGAIDSWYATQMSFPAWSYDGDRHEALSFISATTAVVSAAQRDLIANLL